MRPITKILLAATLTTVTASGLRAQSPATQPTLSPEALAALHNLSSDEFATRQRALKDLELAMGQQIQALLIPDDPESQARVSSLLEFNEGLSRWILNTLALPEPQRHALLAIGLRSDMLATVAKLAAKSPDTRVEGIHEVAQLHDATASDLLAPLLDDDDREVYIAAMEAAWDLPATQSLIDSLWNRAIDAGFAAYSPTVQPARSDIKFRGKSLGASYVDNSGFRKMQDADIACDVLVHLNSPLVIDKLVAFFRSVDEAVTTPNSRENRLWLFGPSSAPMRNTYQLLTAYHPKEVLPVLFHLATGPNRQTFQGIANNIRYFSSNRTMPLVMLILFTDQKPEEYKLLPVAQPVGTWAFPSQEAENNAITKIKSWWDNNPTLHPAALPPPTPAAQTP